MKSTDTSYCTELYVSEQSVACTYHSAKSAAYHMLQASYLTREHQNFCDAQARPRDRSYVASNMSDSDRRYGWITGAHRESGRDETSRAESA